MIVYAMTNYDIYTNEMLTVHQLNNNKHSMGINADLFKVETRDLFEEKVEFEFLKRLIVHLRSCIVHKSSNVLGWIMKHERILLLLD